MPRPIRIPLVLVAALLVAAGCSDVTNPDQGNVRVVLSASNTLQAAPALGDDDDQDDGERYVSRLESANVTFSSLLARNLSGQLVDLGGDLPRTVDVVGLMGGDDVTLPSGSLPPGEYDQLVVVMTELELVFLDGSKIALSPPGGGWTSIVPVAPFTVVEGQDLVLELDLNLGRTFRQAGSAFRFFPEFEGHRR